MNAQPTAPPGGATPSSSEATRQRLIEAGLALFSRHGYDGVTTRSLAARARVNQAAIPYHFGGKAGVYLAVADAICDDLAARLHPILADALADPQPRAALPGLIARMFRLSQDDPGNRERFAIMSFAQQRPDQAFTRFHERLHRPLIEALVILLERTAGPAPDALAAQARAQAVLGLISGFVCARASVAASLGDGDALGPVQLTAIETQLGDLVRALVRGWAQPDHDS